MNVESNIPGVDPGLLQTLGDRAVEFANAILVRQGMSYELNIPELKVKTKADAEVLATRPTEREKLAKTLGSEIVFEVRRTHPALTRALVFQRDQKRAQGGRDAEEVLSSWKRQAAGKHGAQAAVCRILGMWQVAYAPTAGEKVTNTGPWMGKDGKPTTDPANIKINDSMPLTGAHRKQTFAAALEDFTGDDLATMMRRIGYSDASVRKAEAAGDVQALAVFNVSGAERKRKLNFEPATLDAVKARFEQQIPLDTLLAAERQDLVQSGDVAADKKKWTWKNRSLHDIFGLLGPDPANPAKDLPPLPTHDEMERAFDKFFTTGTRTLEKTAADASATRQDKLAAAIRVIFENYFATFDLWGGRGLTVLPVAAEEIASGDPDKHRYDFALAHTGQQSFLEARTGVREFLIPNQPLKEFGARGVDWDLVIMDEFARKKAAAEQAAADAALANAAPSTPPPTPVQAGAV